MIMSDSETVLGIDLGTSTSCVAVVDEGKPRVISDAQGRKIIPSIVAFTADGEVLGHEARGFLIHEPENTVYSFKRIIGCRFGEPQTKAAISGFPYRVVEGPNCSTVVEARGKSYSIPEISARVLGKLKEMAETELGSEITRAVCAVPPAFNDAQRAATRIAGRIAGLEVIHVINEPTAAALAFGYDCREVKIACVYDFGGGTFDCTVLEIDGQVVHVLACESDPFLGGDDFDHALATTVAELFRRETGQDLWKRIAEWQRLLFECEAAKRRLGEIEETVIEVPEIAHTAEGVLDLVFTLDREKFEQICGDLVDRSFELCARSLESAGITVDDVEGVILVGGTTGAKTVHRGAQRFFGMEPDMAVDPQHAVALGAAIQGAKMSGQSVARAAPANLLERTTNAVALGVPAGFHVIIEKNQPLPASAIRSLMTTQDFQTDLTISIFHGRGSEKGNWGYLGDVMISGLEPAAAGEVQVDVTITVNEQDRVSVTAVDSHSGEAVSCHLGEDHKPTSAEMSEIDDELKKYLSD